MSRYLGRLPWNATVQFEAPGLTARRGRTEAAMQRRQAQRADRRWVQENLHEQRRARR